MARRPACAARSKHDGLSYRDAAGKAGGKPLEATASGSREKGVGEKYSMHAFGAVFVEVAIDPDVKTMSVRRLVGAYGAGRIVNPRLATSQCTGGMIGGIGMALMESTALDARDGRPVNAHMADYLMPVNLDIHAIEAHFVDETDPHVNHWASRAWAKSRWSAWRRRSPMRSSTPPANACATCRSRSRTCSKREAGRTGVISWV